MTVRCWLMVGTPPSTSLPPERYMGFQIGDLPEANTYQPGDWITWRAGATGLEVVLVCADVPL